MTFRVGARNHALRARVQRFDRLCAVFPCRRPTELLAVHTMNASAYQELQLAAKTYLSRVLKSPTTLLDEDDLCAQLLERRDGIKNVTPTGMILPKKYSGLEFNLLMRAFYRAISTMGIDDLIDVWQIPMHLRIKYPSSRPENLNRPRHAPEERHLDSWSSYSSQGITVLVPLFGDVENNTVEFFQPPEDFDEIWLAPPVDKNAREAISVRYDPVEVSPKRGEIFLYDAAALHATRRNANCGVRLSIDNIFVPRLSPSEQATEIISPERREEQRRHRDLLEIGRSTVFVFHADDDQMKDTRGGSVDPTHFYTVELDRPERRDIERQSP